MDRIAAKARVSQRQARRVIRSLETKGLISTRLGGGRKADKKIVTNQYRFDIKHLRLKADILSGLEAKPGHSEHETRTFEAGKADIAVSGESPLTIKNLQEEALKTPFIEEEKKITTAGEAVLSEMRKRFRRT